MQSPLARLADSAGSQHEGRGHRVAAIIDAVQVSGPGRQLAALAKSLALVGVELLVVTFHRGARPRAPYLDHLDREGVRYALLEESGPFDPRLLTLVSRVLA